MKCVIELLIKLFGVTDVAASLLKMFAAAFKFVDKIVSLKIRRIVFKDLLLGAHNNGIVLDRSYDSYETAKRRELMTPKLQFCLF